MKNYVTSDKFVEQKFEQIRSHLLNLSRHREYFMSKVNEDAKSLINMSQLAVKVLTEGKNRVWFHIEAHKGKRYFYIDKKSTIHLNLKTLSLSKSF